MGSINNVHDKYFRSAMRDLRVARDFMAQHLPRDILAVIELSTLSLQPESFIDPNFRQLISDVLYKVKIKERDSYIYLLAEHQSAPDRLMAFRLLRYVFAIMAYHSENNKKDDLPVVVPLVFYRGQRIYPYSTDFFDLFGESKSLAKRVLFQPFHLVDVNIIPDEALKQHVWSGVLTFMQKHIFARDLFRCIDEIMPLLKDLMTAGADHYIMSTMKYVVSAGNIEHVEELAKLTDTLSSALGDKIMTLAERLEAKGKAKGKAEGKAEGKVEGKVEAANEIAKKLLSGGVAPNVIAYSTGLSPAAINAIAMCATKES